MIYRFDTFELDTGLFELRGESVPVPLEPQVFALMSMLVENSE
jgi:DNA-binding winged helix-turn-helix (wHTH) protein